ncbi:MAG: hypothetical protein KA234_00470 [Saprospiraceae bacterium]|nr:hypothetical protein [Saprospiraceae bacterium]
MKDKIIFYSLSDDNTLVPIDDIEKHKSKPKFLDKETFDYYYIKLNYNRSEMRSLGVGSKTFEKCYKYHYPTATERRLIGGNKIAISQKRVNSNAVNTGKLKKEIPYNDIQSDVLSGKTYSYMCLKYKISEPTLVANLQKHSLLETYREVGILKNVNVDAYESLERLLNRPIIKKLAAADKDMEYIQNFIYEAEVHVRKCKEVAQSLRSRFGLGASRSPNSRFERYVMEILDERCIEYIPQYRVDSVVFDIYIPSLSLGIECDGFLHTKDADAKKDKIAKDNNMNLVRVDFSKIKNNSKRLCLQEIESHLYQWLV